MHLPQTAEYALRAMACIALRKDGRPVSSEVLARAAGIPKHYLSKIMHKLVEADLVVSQKGHGGGFRLAQKPEKITFQKILHAIDYKIYPDDCVFGWEDCNIDKHCPLHDCWIQLNQSFLWWAENMTLKKVIEEPYEE